MHFIFRVTLLLSTAMIAVGHITVRKGEGIFKGQVIFFSQVVDNGAIVDNTAHHLSSSSQFLRSSIQSM